MVTGFLYPEDTVKVLRSTKETKESSKNKKDSPKEEYAIVARVWHDEHEQLPTSYFGIEDETGLGRALEDHEYGVEILPDRERAIVHESMLELVDRAFQIGDICKLAQSDSINSGSSSRSGMFSGVVTDVEVELELQQVINKNLVGSNIPAKKVRPALPFAVGDHVLYENWVGIINDIYQEALVETDYSTDLMRGGSPASYGIFRHGLISKKDSSGQPMDPPPGIGLNFVRSEYNPHVVDMRQTVVHIDWLAMNGKLSPSQQEFERKPRYVWTHLDQLTLVRPFQEHHFEIDDHVVFKSDVAARGYTNHVSLHGPPTIECNVMRINTMRSSVTVLWQDGKTTKHQSTQLTPYSEEDDHDVWPGDHVLFLEMDGKERGAVVKSMNPVDRTAEVFLYDEKDGIHGKTSAESMPVSVSILDLKTAGSPGYKLSINRGETVVISNTSNPFPPPNVGRVGDSNADGGMSEEEYRTIINGLGSQMMASKPRGVLSDQKRPKSAKNATEIDWFGVVVDMQSDGTALVELPSGRRISVTIDKLALLDDGYNDGGQLDDFSDDDSDEEDDSENSSEFSMEDVPWVTEDGNEIDDLEGGDWEDDEDEDDDDDDDEDSAEEVEKSVLSTKVDNATMSIDEPYASIDKAKKESATEDKQLPVFAILEEAPKDHAFYIQKDLNFVQPKQTLTRLRKEYKILESSLPSTILVRAYEDRTDLLRALIIGTPGTPYEDAPFLIDFRLRSQYPLEPPQAFFHSWTDGHGRLSPNLYEEGKICLSILNTWQGEQGEQWDPVKSTLLQVLISIQGLVLVTEPYFTEPGFEKQKDTSQGTLNSRNYSEKAYISSRRSILHALRYPIKGLEEETKIIFNHQKVEEILTVMRKLVENSLSNSKGKLDDKQISVLWSENNSMTKGGQLSLERVLKEIEKVVSSIQ